MVRRHFLHMLGIGSLDQIRSCCIPLTEHERLTFVARKQGAIVITPEQFRVDLQQPRDSEFNATAISVFASDLHAKVTKHGWYSLTYDGPRPLAPELITIDYLEYTLYHHLKHVREVYKQIKTLTPVRKDERRKLAARKQRKQTVTVFVVAI